MIMRLMSLGIPAAGFFAAGVIASQAEPAKAPPAASAAKAEPAGKTAEPGQRRKVVTLRVVKDGDAAGGTGKTLIIDGDEIAGDVDELVSEALAGALAALEDARADIRVKLDGKKLEAMSEKHRETLDRAREKLARVGEDLTDRMAEVEVQVERAAKEAATAARKAGEALEGARVIVLRDGDGKEAEIKVESGGDGQTVIVIEGEKVKVITRKTGGQSGKADTQED